MDYIYFTIYYFFLLIAKVLPLSIMNKLLFLLSKFIYQLTGKHRNIIDTNLNLAFGDTMNQNEKKRIGIYTFYNLLQTIIGLMKRNGQTSEELLKNISFKNEDIIKEMIKNNQKIILITGHFSNWELLAPAIASKLGITLYGVGRKLNSELMDKVLRKNREKFGVKMIDRKGAMQGTIKALKKNNAIGLLMDQSLYEHQGAIKVDFFGKSVGHSPAASVLARMFNANVIPVFISTNDYINYTVTFYKPLPLIKTKNKEEDILQMTQDQADITQKVISEKPEEWFWLHKRWKTFHPELYSSLSKH